MTQDTGIARRELLRRAAVLMGGALSAPAVMGLANGAVARPAPAGWRPALLTTTQLAVVAEVADIMIPRTDTPGARDVGVPEFIDDMLANVYPPADQKRFLTGLAELEAVARREHRQAFAELSGETREALVRRVHDVALEAGGPGGVPSEERPFILMTKELTLLGFFTSEAGATEVLQHDELPGAYVGCQPLTRAGNGRTWATEKNLPF